MPISEKTYERVALEDPDGLWELVCGRLQQKTGMTTEHGFAIQDLSYQLSVQLDLRTYSVRTDPVRLRAPSGSHHISDLCVIPRASLRRALAGDRRERLEVFFDAVPFVVEVWSRSTRGCDGRTKLADYRERGDEEIWLIHPRRRTITAWRRQADGIYTESVYTSGSVPVASLPNVTVELDALFGGS